MIEIVLKNLFSGDRLYSLMGRIVYTVLQKLISYSWVDYLFFFGNFAFCSLVLFLLQKFYKSSKNGWLFFALALPISFLILVFLEYYVALHYTAYSLFFWLLYFFVIILFDLLYLYLQKKNKVSDKVLRVFKYWFFILLNWVFLFFSLYYFVSEHEALSVGIIELFVFIFFVVLVVCLIFLRHAVLSSMKTHGNLLLSKSLRALYSSTWFSVFLFWFIWLSESSHFIKLGKSFFSIAVFFGVHVLVWYLRSVMHSYVYQTKQYKSEKIKIYKLIRLVANIFIDPVIAFLMFYIWGFSLSIFLSAVFGEKFLITILRMFGLFLFYRGSLIFSDLFVRRLIRRQEIGKDTRNMNLIRRFETLTSMLKIILRVIIFIICLFVLFSFLGFNTSSFGAFGFGLAGISLGFQSLAKDFVTGVVMMFEDTFHIGDTVMIGGVSGKIEEITLRVLKIRDIEGSLIFIPFNKVDVVFNKSRSYIFVMFSVAVDITVDLEKVIKLMKQAGKDLIKTAEFKDQILADEIDIFGPISVQDGRIMVEARLKIMPISPKRVRSAYYTICKKLFKEAGIDFAQNTVLAQIV